MPDFELARHSNRLGAGNRGNGGLDGCDGSVSHNWPTDAPATADWKPPGVPPATVIADQGGEFYAMTVAEAVDAGFRRAFR